MKKVRIIKRTTHSGVSYTIQQKHFLFKWWWVGAWVNTNCDDTFSTLEEAKAEVALFEGKGTGVADEVVYKNFK